VTDDDDEMADRLRELEYTRQEMEQRQQTLQDTLTMQRRQYQYQQQQQEEQQPVSVSGVAVEMIDKGDTHTMIRSQRRRKQVLGVVLFVMLVLVVSVTTGVLLQKKQQQDNAPSEPITEQTEVMLLIDLLVGEYPNLDKEQMLTEGTPQNRAISYMNIEEFLHPEEISTVRDGPYTGIGQVPIRIVAERYALWVIYYTSNGIQGEDWTTLQGFSTVCFWDNIECNTFNGDSVTDLLLGEYGAAPEVKAYQMYWPIVFWGSHSHVLADC